MNRATQQSTFLYTIYTKWGRNRKDRPFVSPRYDGEERKKKGAFLSQVTIQFLCIFLCTQNSKISLHIFFLFFKNSNFLRFSLLLFVFSFYMYRYVFSNSFFERKKNSCVQKTIKEVFAFIYISKDKNTLECK